METTRSNQTKGAKAGAKRKYTPQEREAKKRKRIVIVAVELVVLLAMFFLMYKLYADSAKKPEINIREYTENEKVDLVAPEVTDNEALQGYWNIALFGVDAMTDKELFKSSRSDSMMIASINRATGEIRLVSVYRDTYLNIGNDSYRKCNTAYSLGGADQALKMLNMNLDLDITDFVTVGYGGLRGVIDGLGGVWIDVDSEELKHINNYQISIAEVLKCDYVPVKNTGYQKLDGLQATAYCRIRYTAGSDYKRTARQREVLKAIEEQAKQASLADLVAAFENAEGDIYTSIQKSDIMELLTKISDYSIVAEGGFPEETRRTDGSFGSRGSLVVPMNLEENVVWLHEFLFDATDYKVSDRVKEYSSVIEADTSPYLNK